ncbi:MAG: sigma-E factor regulatory protein RseB domain-containing protein [Planctomycetota bacterium]
MRGALRGGRARTEQRTDSQCGVAGCHGWRGVGGRAPWEGELGRDPTRSEVHSCGGFLGRLRAAVVVVFAAIAATIAAVGCGQQGAELLEKVGAAQDHLSYQAVRVYRSYQAQRCEWVRERITRGTDGRFLLELLSLNGDTPESRAEPDFRKHFEVLATLYRSGLGRQIVLERDFRLRFRELIAQNYDIVQDVVDELFLERHTFVVRLVPREGRSERPAWRVRVDKETGLVVEYQEYDPEGGLMASMAFESIDYQPSLDGIEFPAYDRVERRELSIDEAKGAVPFKLYEPQWYPNGFTRVAVQLISLSVRGADHSVVQFTYSDGVVEFVLFESPPLDDTPPPGDGMHGEGPFEVSLFQYGTLSLAEFRIGDTYCHISGKVPGDTLRAIIESFAEVP